MRSRLKSFVLHKFLVHARRLNLKRKVRHRQSEIVLRPLLLLLLFILVIVNLFAPSDRPRRNDADGCQLGLKVTRFAQDALERTFLFNH